MNDYQYLKPNTVVNGYTVDRLLGHGATCAAYSVHDDKGAVYILKEYAPRKQSCRSSDGSIIPTNEEKFSEGRARFIQSLDLQRTIRQQATNSTPLMVEYFTENNTEYAVVCGFDGECYADVIEKEKSLSDLLKRIRAIADIVKVYHDTNKLILDLKPENLFTIKETCELMLLIDFDSVANLNEDLITLYSKEWSAPEVIQKKLFGKSADVFSIGEMLFFGLFGRHTEKSEKNAAGNIDISECALVTDASQELIGRLETLVTRCVTYAKNLRPTAEEVSNELSALILLCERPILCDNRPRSDSFFTGREKELAKIEEELCTKRGVCVYGTGGIGKSELARRFSESRKGTVVFLQCNGSIKNMLISGVCIRGIDLTKRTEQDALAQIAAAVDENTLLIADNVDDINNVKEELDLLLSLNCKLLITTRLDSEKFSALSRIPLLPMPMDELMVIFETNYGRKKLGESDRNAAEECLRICGELPLMAVLLAKQMTASRIAPKKMLATLKQSGVSALGEESVEFGTRTEENTTSILRILFDMSKLDKSQLYLMAIMALAPVRGFDINLVMKWSGQKNYNTFNSMKRLGWLNIEYSEEHEYVVMHPLVSQVVLAFLAERAEGGSVSAKKFMELCDTIRCTLEEVGDYYSLISLAEKECIFENNTNQNSHWTLNRLAKYYSVVCRYADAEQCLLNAVSDYNKYLSDNNAVDNNIQTYFLTFFYKDLYVAAKKQEKYDACLEYLDKERLYNLYPDETDYFVRRCDIIGRRDGKERQAELLYEELCAADEQPERKSSAGLYMVVIAYIDALIDLGQTEKARATAEKYAEDSIRFEYCTLELIAPLHERFPDSELIKERFEILIIAEQSEWSDCDEEWLDYLFDGDYDAAEESFYESEDSYGAKERVFFLKMVLSALWSNPMSYYDAVKTAEHAYSFFEKLVPSTDEEYIYKVKADLALIDIRMCFLSYFIKMVESKRCNSISDLLPDYEERRQENITALCLIADSMNESGKVHSEIAWEYIHVAINLIIVDYTKEAESCLEKAEKTAEQLGNISIAVAVRFVRLMAKIRANKYTKNNPPVEDILEMLCQSSVMTLYSRVPFLFYIAYTSMLISKNLDNSQYDCITSKTRKIQPDILNDDLFYSWNV
ncbi:MAG: hypothetical protein ACI4WS_08195 [Oscillospiraceae bacterium]